MLSLSSIMSTPARANPRYGSCAQFRPHRDWDAHLQCPSCRICTRVKPCLTCLEFLPDQWRILDTWFKAKESKNALQGLQQPIPPSVASGSQESVGGKGKSGKIGG